MTEAKTLLDKVEKLDYEEMKTKGANKKKGVSNAATGEALRPAEAQLRAAGK